jgi:hypothetical protein
MKTNIALIITTLFCSFQILAQETKVDCNCPTPTEGDIRQLCNEISEKIVAPEDTELSYAYLQTLWRISCAIDGVDNLETARIKIQCMWLKNRLRFSCNLPGVSVPRGNVTKFSLDAGFSDFIIDAVKDYQLDLNFRDPADDRTILDFVKDEIKILKKSRVNVNGKILEYERLYDLLIKYGAKHASEL